MFLCPSYARLVRAREREIIKEEYVDVCLDGDRRRRTTVQNIQRTLEQIPDQLSNMAGKMMEATQIKNQVQLELDGLTNMVSQKSQKSAAEFDDLVAIPEVNHVEFQSGLIRVVTNTISIDHKGKRYPLGTFAIEIVDNEEIRVKNLENLGVNKAYDHPQFKNGKISLPVNLRLPLAKLLTGLEYADIVQLIINLLQSYDPEKSLIALETNWKGVSV